MRSYLPEWSVAECLRRRGFFIDWTDPEELEYFGTQGYRTIKFSPDCNITLVENKELENLLWK